MTEREVYYKIRPFLEGRTEGLNWDFKKTLNNTSEIIKDILAFSNSDFNEDSFLIVGVRESKHKDLQKILLTTEDRQRLNTDAKYIYIDNGWNIDGLNASDLENMKKFSEKLSLMLSDSMLISQPKCEFYPIKINKTRWLYVIVVKNKPGVYLSKKDIKSEYDDKKIVVKQGVLYVRIADITIGARTDVASATEYLRVWKKYLSYLEKSNFEMLKIGE